MMSASLRPLLAILYGPRFGPSLSPCLLCIPVLVWKGDKRVGEVSEHDFQGLSFVFGFVSYLRFGGGSHSGEALEPLGTAVP